MNIANLNLHKLALSEQYSLIESARNLLNYNVMVGEEPDFNLLLTVVEVLITIELMGNGKTKLSTLNVNLVDNQLTKNLETVSDFIATLNQLMKICLQAQRSTQQYLFKNKEKPITTEQIFKTSLGGNNANSEFGYFRFNGENGTTAEYDSPLPDVKQFYSSRLAEVVHIDVNSQVGKAHFGGE